MGRRQFWVDFLFGGGWCGVVVFGVGVVLGFLNNILPGLLGIRANLFLLFLLIFPG